MCVWYVVCAFPQPHSLRPWCQVSRGGAITYHPENAKLFCCTVLRPPPIGEFFSRRFDHVGTLQGRGACSGGPEPGGLMGNRLGGVRGFFFFFFPPPPPL